MTTKLMLIALLPLGFASTAALTGCGSAAAYRLAGTHNDETLTAAQQDYNKARTEAAAKLADTAKAGTDMLNAAKQAQDHPQETAASKLEETTDDYANNVNNAERQREVYADSLAMLREEVQSAKDRWSEVVGKIGDESLKNEEQRRMDRRLRSLDRKLQAAERGLAAYDSAMSRAKDARLVAASLKEDAALGKVGDRIDEYSGQVKQANAELVRAADLLLANLPADESVAGS